MVSTMNRAEDEIDSLIKKMNLKSSATIVNQITKGISLTNKIFENYRVISVNDKGLSKSRNLALQKSVEDICIIADDDVIFEDDYRDIIVTEHKKHPDKDIIAFVVENENLTRRKKILNEGNIGYLKSMKLQSVQITFKRERIIEKDLKFDERFGIGSTYFWGEENIFLFDCLRKGIKIYYVPKKIAILEDGPSMWSKENTPSRYKLQGVIYYRMSKILYPLLIIQFSIRKRNLFKNEMSSIKVMSSMFAGVKEHKMGKL